MEKSASWTGAHNRQSMRWRWWLVLAVPAVLTCVTMALSRDQSVRAATSMRRVKSEHALRWKLPWSLPAARETAIRGRIVAHGRTALAGARVCAVCAGCNILASSPGRCALSEASGDFSLLDVPEGEFVVSAAHPDYQMASARGGKPIAVRAGQSVDGLLIELVRASPTLSGIVLDATGGPITEATVQVANTAETVHPFVQLTTDEEGRFAVALPEGPVAIRAEAPGYAPGLIYRTVPSTDARLALTPGGVIEGTVVHAVTGERVPGVTVSAIGTSSATLVSPVVTDDDGAFCVSGLEPGQYALVAEGDRHHGSVGRTLALGLADHVKNVVIRVQPGVLISGRVLIGDGEKPCAGGRVRIAPSDPFALAGRAVPADPSRRPDMNLPSVEGVIQRSGEVRLRGVPAGRYEVALECDEHVYEDGPVVLNVGEQDFAVTWRVRNGLGLSVQVHDEFLNPVPRANLMLEFPPAGSSGNVFVGLAVDERGQATVGGALYPGRYVVHADEAFGAEPTAVELREGDGTKTVSVVLPGAAAIRVKVRDARGNPIDDVDVAAYVQHMPGDPSSTEAAARGVAHRAVPMGSGEFVIRPLPAGDYKVTVWDGVNPPLNARGATGQVVSLRRGEQAAVEAVRDCQAQLSGVVVDDLGDPVANAWVSAAFSGRGEREPGTLSISSELSRILTDQDGQFALVGLCASASYDVRVEQQEAAVSVTAALRPRAGVRLVLPRAGELEGTVHAADGRPLREFNLTVEHAGTRQTRGLRVQAQDGSFRLENVPAGESTVTVSSADSSASSRVVISPGALTGGVQLRLEPEQASAASVNGR